MSAELSTMAVRYDVSRWKFLTNAVHNHLVCCLPEGNPFGFLYFLIPHSNMSKFRAKGLKPR